jgi:hypothetical protein
MKRADRQLAPQPIQLAIPLIADAGTHDRARAYRGGQSLAGSPHAPRREHTVSARTHPIPPRLAVTLAEAATVIGVSEASFRRHVLPALRVVEAGPRLTLVRLAELDRWLERNQAVRLL